MREMQREEEEEDNSSVTSSQIDETEGLIRRQKRPPTLPLFKIVGETLMIVSLSMGIQTTLLAFYLSGASWMSNYWGLLAPTWAVTFALFVYFQARRVLDALPITIRLTFTTSVLLIDALLVLYGVRLQDPNTSINTWELFIIPWIIVFDLLILEVASIFLYVKHKGRDRRRFKLSSLIIGSLLIIWAPLVILGQFKLQGAGYSWFIVMIPLWMTDFFFFFMACTLFVFTLRTSGFFTLPQLGALLAGIVASMSSKITIGLKMDQTINIGWPLTFIPLWPLWILLFILGFLLRMGQDKK